jgi:RES domain
VGNFQPPNAPPAAPTVVILAAGTRLSRVHSSRFAASQFNPTLADAHWGGGRFDATQADPYGYLYAASDDESAVCETLLRDLPLAPGGGRLLPRAAVAGRVLSRLVLSAEVALVSLCSGQDLARLGQSDNWLVSCPSSEYGYARRWGQAIRAWAPAAVGLVWPSRRDPSKRACVFFGDRFSAALDEDGGGVPPTPGGLPLDSGVGMRYLLEILARYWVTLAP